MHLCRVNELCCTAEAFMLCMNWFGIKNNAILVHWNHENFEQRFSIWFGLRRKGGYVCVKKRVGSLKLGRNPNYQYGNRIARVP